MNYSEFNIKELNLYEILEIENNASTEDIRKSYKRLSLKYHPDKQIKSKLSETEKSLQFIKIRDAYEILSDSAKRKKYDNEILIKNFGHGNLTNVINDLQNILTSKESIIFMNILDNKIKQSFLNNVKIDDLFIRLNQMNLMDIFFMVKDFKILDIEIKLDFTLQELYNNTYQKVIYNRITKEIFKEIIYPIDLIQIYENEGETINIGGMNYSGNFIVNINIKNNLYNNINYQILENDLYASINKKYFYSDDILKIKYLDDNIYDLDIKEIK
jgi:curved DNA-binding protein CbpA